MNHFAKSTFFSQMPFHASICSIAFLFATSCGKSDSNKPWGNSKNNTPEPQWVQAQLSVDSGASNSALNLVSNAAQDFVVVITSCASGHTATVTSTSATPVSSVPLYQTDTDCVAELESLTVAGSIYTKDGGGRLTTGAALFKSAGAQDIYVSVSQNLPSPLTSGAVARFNYVQSATGADYLANNVSVSAGLEVGGVDAPFLKIPTSGVTLKAISNGTGIPSFEFLMECRVPTTTGNTICPSATGTAQLMTGMKVKLVQDTFSNVLSYADAQTIMASGSSTVIAGDLSTTPTNGGFKLTLSGPGRLTSFKNLILVTEYKDTASGASSYRYFNLDIGNPN